MFVRAPMMTKCFCTLTLTNEYPFLRIRQPIDLSKSIFNMVAMVKQCVYLHLIDLLIKTPQKKFIIAKHTTKDRAKHSHLSNKLRIDFNIFDHSGGDETPTSVKF